MSNVFDLTKVRAQQFVRFTEKMTITSMKQRLSIWRESDYDDPRFKKTELDKPISVDPDKLYLFITTTTDELAVYIVKQIEPLEATLMCTRKLLPSKEG